MELKGIEIFKYLPAGKKEIHANCKKCKLPTCMAFALKLAKKAIDINICPYISDELRKLYEEVTKIQQHEIIFENNSKTGGEIAMFRHEKTFVNKTLFIISLNCDNEDFEEKFYEIKNYSYERIGEEFRFDGIFLEGKKNYEKAKKLIKESGFFILDEKSNIKYGKNLEELAKNSNEKDLILELEIKDKPLNKIIEELSNIRYMAIKKRDEAFSHPILTRLEIKDLQKAAILASTLICKYSNLIIFDKLDKSLMSGLFILRQNIFTDPQKPLQVDSGVYELNEPDENAIVVMTTNFALTYFAVRNEIEPLNIPCYLVITPSDGMSVLTAWSAEKFTSQMVAKIINENEKVKKVKNKSLILPGLLSHMKEELENELQDWEIKIGPVEALKLPEFIKSLK